MPLILSARDLTKTYRSGDRMLTVVNKVSFDLQHGETCAVVGPSGSGKTTILGLCAGLDRATSGHVHCCGERLDTLSEGELARFRNREVGFIFQTFQLIPTLTALENVMVPAELHGGRAVRQRALDLLKQVGLEERTTHYPTQLSGGEQQRVAIARAFINRPRVLFADEPTGNLDADTGTTIENLLFGLNETANTTLLLVTHNLDLARRTGRIIELRAGEVISDAPVHAVGMPVMA